MGQNVDFKQTQSVQSVTPGFRVVSKWFGPTPAYIPGQIVYDTASTSSQVVLTGTKERTSPTVQGDGVTPTIYQRFSLKHEPQSYNYTREKAQLGAKRLDDGVMYWGYHITRYSGRSEGFPYSAISGAFSENGILPDTTTRGLADSRALNRLIRNKINHSENIIQAGRLGAEILEKATAVLKAWRALGRSLPQEALQHLDSAFNPAQPNNWLALQYGWLPLMSDIENNAKNIIQILEDADKVFVRVDAAETREIEFWSSLDSLSYEQDGTGRWGTQVGYLYRQRVPGWNALAKIGMSNPLLIAWENMPYTFMIDWFANVSAFLEALGATQGFSLESGYATTFAKFESVITQRAYSISLTDLVEGKLPSWKSSGQGMRRDIGVTPLPTVRVNVRLSPKRLLNFSAVLTSARTGPPPRWR